MPVNATSVKVPSSSSTLNLVEGVACNNATQSTEYCARGTSASANLRSTQAELEQLTMRPAMPNVNSLQNAHIFHVNSPVTHPGQGAIPSVLVNKFSGDVMEFPEFRRKFKRFVEAV